MNKRILIIEDDGSIAELERDYLEVSDFEAEIATDGYEGLEKAQGGDFDLILLDVMLPGMDGFEVLKELRKKSNTPIIMVTARKDDVDKVLGLGLGADDYITKPFSPSELVARVKAHISRFERLTSKESTDILEVKGLRIDKAARRVFTDGIERNLTGKEYDLLLFLAENPDRVFTKDEIFREVWDQDSIGETSSVTVYIKKIREKIEPDSEKSRYIDTIWGVGYRFKG
ncbi:MAG: response regulator transcription factor [Eubacteriales bacterium]|nr:response regulator transcription factor [Eubacteriales bacterium]